MERIADALGDGALDLSTDAGAVDHPPDILGDHIARHMDIARDRIHFDLGIMHMVGRRGEKRKQQPVGAARIKRYSGQRRAARTLYRFAAECRRRRHFGQGHAALVFAGHANFAVFDAEGGGLHLQQLRRRFERLGANFLGALYAGEADGLRRPSALRSAVPGGKVGVRVGDAHLFGADAKGLGDDLRNAGGERARAIVGRRRVDAHRAIFFELHTERAR